jgi:hypothetical protein
MMSLSGESQLLLARYRHRCLSGLLPARRPDRNLGSWKCDTSIPLAYRLDLVAQLLNEKPRGALLATPIDLPARGVDDDLLAI